MKRPKRPGKRRYLNQVQAAEYIGLSDRHLRLLESRGEGPVSIRVGNRKLYDRQDLDRWMAARKAPNNPPGDEP